MKTLEKLELSFDGVDKISDQGVESLAHRIGGNLKKLKLSFLTGYGRTNQAVHNICTQIANRLQMLQSLDLRLGLNCMRDLGNEMTAKKIRQIFRGNSQLREIYLDLPPFEGFADSGIGNIFSQEEEEEKEKEKEGMLDSLKKFNLSNLWKRGETNKETKSAQTTTEDVEKAKQIDFLGKLESLELYLYSKTYLCDKGIKRLGSQIGKFRTLQRLSLSLQNLDHITDVEVHELSKEIGENLKRLKYLHLSFPDWQNNVDEGVHLLMTQIVKNLQELKSLELGLYNTNITDKGVQEIVLGAGNNLPQLEHFGLDLNESICISEAAFVLLAYQIGENFRRLRSLKLTLGGPVTDFVMRELGVQIATQLPSLEDFTLSVQDTWQITNNGVKGFALPFVNRCQKIQNFVLNFSRTENLTSVDYLTSIFASNRKLLGALRYHIG